MPPLLSPRRNALVDKHWRRVAFDYCSQLALRHNSNSIDRLFPESDDATWHMPAGAIKPVISPSKQGVTSMVLDQQIDVDERRNPAEKEKQFLGHSIRAVVNVLLHLADQVRQSRRCVSQS